MLSEAECERARQARDPRFDGRFFVGVRTTGIYCRPVCPVRLPKARNVRFFPSAAAAAGAGFRPCLRCRPEAAPGSPAWRGSEVTVTRALRLIDEGALDGDGHSVETLAARLGIGTRHLSRLFNEHVGASPIAVAQTRRLHFAKKLIDETNLPMTEVALSAGFGSVRRFNTVLRRTYGRSPSELRRLHRKMHKGSKTNKGPAKHKGNKTHNGLKMHQDKGEREPIVLRLSYRPPHDLSQLFRFFAEHAIEGIEQVTATCYRRTAWIDGVATSLEVRATSGHVELRVSPQATAVLMALVTRVRALFDLNASPETVAEHLRKSAASARLLSEHGLPRIPGGWERFEMIVRAILGQGVSVAAARTFGKRLVARWGERFEGDAGLGHLFPTAQALREAELATIGITRTRAAAIGALAGAVCDGTLDLNAPNALDAMSTIRGIGPWTRSYVALRGFGEPDAFPAEDLVLRRVLNAKTTAQAERAAEPWRPWRGYAAMLLWQQA